MCDHGRNDFAYVNSRERILMCKSDGKASLDIHAVCKSVGEKLAEYAKKDPGSVAGIASAWLTVEELYTFKTLFVSTLGSFKVGVVAQPAGKEEVFPGFKIEADKNPNRAGAKLVLGEQAEGQTAIIIEGITAGTIKALYVVNCMPHYDPPKVLLDALKKLEFLVVQDILSGPLTAAAHVVLPGSSFVEKDGVLVNGQNRAQLLRRAIDPLAQGHDDLSVLQRVSKAAGNADAKLVSAREVFRRVGESVPEFARMTHQVIGERGTVVKS
jgi:predicted molibdopterin-dependent oxidoreductase YjgC